MKALLYTSVDIFAMITGYIYIDKNTMKYNRIVGLWGVCFLYSALISIWTIINRPEFLQSKTAIVRSFFPPIEGRYWYITCYTLLFFLIPYINRLLNSLKENESKNIIIILFMGLSVITSVGFYDYFRISYGYSVAWLIFCYMIGAFLKRYGCKKKTRMLLTWLIGSIAVMSRSQFIYYKVGETMKHYLHSKDWLVEYNSPLTVLSAYVIMILATRIHGYSNRIVSLIARTTFGVYIIHSHPIIYDFYIKDAFKDIALMSCGRALLRLTISIILIFMLCSIVDIFRTGVIHFFRFVCSKLFLRRENSNSED